MVRKIQTEDAYYVISDDSSLDESELQKLASSLGKQTTITQPNFVIDMRHDYKFVQLKALWLIIEQLQPVILANIKTKTSLFVETTNAILNTARNEVEVVLPIADLGYQRSHYKAIQNALLDLACIQVTYPRESYKIRKAIHGKGTLCTYVGYSQDENDRRKLLAHFFFSLDIATCLVSPQIGFTKLLHETLMCSTNVYTSKIYMYISRSADGNKWRISYPELREKLCVGDKFPRYYDFRNRILKEAEKELRQNANHWFGLTEQFSKRGAAAPEHLIFTIYSVDGTKKESREFTSRRDKIFETMTETLKIKAKVARSAINRITTQNIEYIWKKHNMLLAHISINRDKIEDLQAYYLGAIQRILDSELYNQPAKQQKLF